jgi:hypothetical protein
MNDDLLYAPTGTKLKFLNANGYLIERKNAADLGLVEGVEYTLHYVDINDSSSDVYLDEFPNRGFNSVMFECIPYEHTTTIWMDGFRHQCG